MDNLIGKRVEGRYEITELIGVGGMANVYKAVDVLDKKSVAIKILREEFYENEEFLRRFKNESKAIAMLSHPNIVKVYDVCFSRGMQMIVMEYLDGITLKEYMQQQPALGWKEATHFVRQILQALSHAHSRGVVHRDMKPQNVMLLPDGTLKLADFGIARFARSEAKTLTDKAIGSVHYISPEQARGEGIDQRTDIYSVGVMLFEMLTGELPFDADSPVSVALKQIQLDAPSMRKIKADIPHMLEEITAKAMQKNPDLRYQTAQEMLSDVEVFRKNPEAMFEYQYLTDRSVEEAKYKRAIRRVRGDVTPAEKKGNEPMTNRKSKRQSAPQETRYVEKAEGGGSVMMVLAGITAAFVVISMTFIFTMLYINNPLEKVPDTKVPDFIGLSYDAVKSAPEYKNLQIVVEETRFNALHPKGAIVDQTPKAGKTVKVNSTVKVIVSSGEQMIDVPNVVGFEETVAYKEIVDAGLEYQKVEIFSPQPRGTVVSTEPGAGSKVGEGDTVKILVSMGPQSTVVSVPSIVGMTLDEAKRTLTEAGLLVGAIGFESSDKPADTVLSQEPVLGSQINMGGLVNFTVSSGQRLDSSVALRIPLPKEVNDTVKLTARYEDRTLKEDMVVPSKALYWRPAFTGSGTVMIHILYNDFLYMSVEVNFTDGSWVITEDNTAAHF